MAHAGPDGYLDAMNLTWAEAERGMAPGGRAVRSGATQLCQDIANDPQYLPWRDEALKRGLASNIALPLKNGDGSVFGVLHVYAGEVDAFTHAEIGLLEEMAGDLAFGVRSLQTREERDLVMGQLQNSLEGTVRAIASMVEMRDPYTAGHQARVADLAVVIARQMGLPEEQVHAIYLAGMVHDLGKIQVPAEILSKAGKTQRDRIQPDQDPPAGRLRHPERYRFSLADRGHGAATPRTHGWLGLPARTQGRGHPARSAHPQRGGRGRGDLGAPPLPSRIGY